MPSKAPVSYEPRADVDTRQRRLDAMRELPGQVRQLGLPTAVGGLLIGRRPIGMLRKDWQEVAEAMVADLDVAGRIVDGLVVFDAETSRGSLPLSEETLTLLAQYGSKLKTQIPDRVETFCDPGTAYAFLTYATSLQSIPIGEADKGLE